MARVYNPTRLMLDANTMANIGNARAEREDSRNRMIASGIAGILRGGQEAIERGNRRAMFEGEEWENPSDWGDKDYQVAKETFINTGDVSALNAYRQRKLQEREQKMREDELATRKKLAEIENKRGEEIAGKERESQIEELMTSLKKSLVQRDSESVTPDVRSIANIDVAYYRNKLKRDYGIELSDEDIENIGGNKKESETGEESVESEPKEVTFFDKVMTEQDLSARKRKLKERIADARKNGISDVDKAELIDVAMKVGDATEGAKRDDEFLTITKDIDKLVTNEDKARYQKKLADEYAGWLNDGPARINQMMRKDPKKFEQAKKAYEALSKK